MHSKVAVIGGGLMGAGLAQVFAENGCDVSLYEPIDDARDTVLARIAENIRQIGGDVAAVDKVSVSDDLEAVVTSATYVTEAAPEKLELYNEKGIGAIVRMDRDGSNWEVYARGIRNSVGQGFNPANGELWFTDNQVDGMGDLIPPGELNRTTGAGQHFGFPWFGGGKVRTNEYANSEPPADAIFPAVEMDAHAADLGMTFYTGKMFPPKYRGGIFIAQHGSWNRTDPVGARIMFTSLDEDGAAAGTEVFAYGWLDEETGEYHGRPVDVVQYLDGSLLVSDDQAGAIYRISYGE